MTFVTDKKGEQYAYFLTADWMRNSGNKTHNKEETNEIKTILSEQINNCR